VLTNNKILTIIITVLLLFALVSCKGTETNNDNLSSSNSNNYDSSTEFVSDREALMEEASGEDDGILGEAEVKAGEFWEKKYTKCGDSHYSHHLQKFDSFDKETYLEIKGMTWTVEEWSNGEKSEADRLNETNDPNAVIWKGASKLRFTSMRTWNSTQAKIYENGWDKWIDKSNSDAFSTVRMFYLKNGEWQIEDRNTAGNNSVKPVNCEEIPN
jgi:hypothetical protein